MVKAVVGEESQLKLIEDRLSQSGLSCQVGLVIGKISSALDRGFVFDLVPTPPNDAGAPACWIIESTDDKKKGSKAKSQSDSSSSSSLSIDKDWVSEHARQVSRMLLGGVKVVGIYIWVSETTLKNSTIVLCQTTKGVAEAAPLTEIVWDERLVIHISYSPRRWTCRNFSLAPNITTSSLRPCDFKMGRVLTSLQKFRCLYNFDIRFPIFRESGSNISRFAGILRHVISSHAKELKSATALIDGKLVDVDEPCTLNDLHEVEFLLPFMHDTCLEACSQKEVLGALLISGSVCSFAYSHSKEPISQALADIKGDIISSLQSRLDIICDEAERDLDLVADGGVEASKEISIDTPIPQLDLQLLRKECNLAFPRRVFVPWLAGTYICDYIQPSDTLEVLRDHCVELMSMEAPTDASKILEPEVESTNSLTLSAKSFWDTAIPFSSESITSPKMNSIADRSPECVKKSSKSPNFNILGILLVLVLSVLVGLILILVRAK